MRSPSLSVVHFGKIPQTLIRTVSAHGIKVKSIAKIDELNEYFILNAVDICIFMDNEMSSSDKEQLIDLNTNTTFIILTNNKTRLFKNRVYYLNQGIITNENLCHIFFSSLVSLLINFQNRDDFSAMLLHDTRSPINSIIGYLELLDNGVFGELNEGQKQIIENTIILGDMLIEFIEDFNYIHQYENRDLQLRKVPFDIKKAVDEVLLSIWVQADQKNIKIHKIFKGNFPKIIADVSKIQRVIMNLLHNAIKFSPERGEITIAIKSSDKQHIQVSVTDAGPGFKEKDKKHLFDKYFSVIQQRQGEKNYGLGLYIAKSIINAHKGKIWAENNPDGGSTFFFELKADHHQ